MGKMLRRFLTRWMIDTLAVLAATVVPGITYDRWPHLLLASLMLGIVNTFVRPALLLFTLPLVFISMGLFIFVINALMLLLVDKIVPGFEVSGIWSALGGALVITLVSTALNSLVGPRGNPATSRQARRRGGPPDAGGPVIDV